MRCIYSVKGIRQIYECGREVEFTITCNGESDRAKCPEWSGKK